MIVGLSGRIHSGKDSAGQALVEQLGFKRVAFADGVRDKVIETYGWSREWVYSDAFKEQVVALVYDSVTGSPRTLTGREVLQREGMAARKIFGDDCWVKVAMAKCVGTSIMHIHKIGQSNVECDGVECAKANSVIAYKHGTPQHYVITDVRFQNEFETIKAAGGKVIRLNRLDRGEPHDYKQAATAEEESGFCRHEYVLFAGDGEADTGVCNLPRSAHPSHFSGHTHASETSLPDESNDVIQYDGVLTGDMAHNINGVLDYVRTCWLPAQLHE